MNSEINNDFVRQFIGYLEAENTSRLTVKNYKADVSQFVRWFEDLYQSPFSPGSVGDLQIKLYGQHLEEAKKLSQRSTARHLSSLRRFFSFLKTYGYEVENNLFESKVKENADPWDLKSFRQYLYNNNASSLTIKNYIMDVRQFLSWASSSDAGENFELNSVLIENYKNKLLEKGFSALSVNRKLSSIRRLLQWQKIPSQNIGNIQKAQIFDKEAFLSMHQDDVESLRQNVEKKPYSAVPPIRLAQKISDGGLFVFDKTLVIPLSYLFSVITELAWKAAGKSMFVPTTGLKTNLIRFENIKKEVYAPALVSVQNFPMRKKVFFHLAHTRPKWYQRYHSYSFIHYFHLAILFLFCMVDVLFVYNSLKPNWESQSVLGTQVMESSRSIMLRAKLTDSNNSPILAPSDLRVGIYNDPKASGSALLWEDVVYHVTPDSNGFFTISLGNQKSLPESVFSNSYSTYLGITVGNSEELSPRQQLANSALSSNSQMLAGLLPITASEKTSNVVLALNSSGNLTIGGSANPVFSATGGEFKLSGQPLTLTTNLGSASDVVIAPDGNGMLDIQKPIHNSTNNNNASTAIGAVEVDDLLSVLATSDAQSAFTVNQNGSGKLLSGYAGSTAKFSIDSSGNAYFAGNIGVGTDTPLQSIDVKGNVMLSATAPTLYLGPKNYIGFDTVNTIIYSTTGDIAVHPATSSSFRPFTDNVYSLGASNFRWNSLHVGNGTSTFDGRVNILTNSDASAAATRITNTNQNDTVENVALILALGSSTSSQNSRFIQFLSGATNNEDGTGVGRIRSNGNASSSAVAYESGAADFAEYFEKGEELTTGDIVQLNSKNKAIKAKDSSSAIGVVSETGAFIGNLPKAENEQNSVIVGLLGQLPVKVSTENGPIAVNDPISLGSTPGVGVKATGAGRIIGRAMENLQSGTLSITVLVQPTYYEGDLVARISEALNSQLSIFNSKLVSPVAEIDRIHTNVISPISENPQIAIKLGSQNIEIVNGSGSAVAKFDNAGNATFSGSLSSQSLNTTEASISGTLHAGKIIADQIIGPVSSQSSQFSNLNSTPSAVIADTGQFNLGLISLGPSGFTDLTVSNQLAIGANFVLSENSINVLGQTLNIQQFGSGNISFEGGKIVIDTDGNLNVNGSAVFAKDVSISGVLSTQIISPIPGQDLVIKLSDSGNLSSEFRIKNSTGSAVLVFDQQGNITASGSATVNKLNIFLVSPVYAVSNTEAIATGSAGSAFIKPHQVELTIKNPQVNRDSLIYVTPIGTPSGQTPFLLRQIEHDSFTVGIQQPAFSDTNFNWLIIN